MAQQTIGLGTSANDGTGDTPRVAGDKINDNFVELYAADVSLASSIAGKANTSHTHLVANLSDATEDAKQLLQTYDNTDFASAAHTHILSDVDELVEALAAKVDDSEVGTTANKIVRLTSDAKLPAVDGSLLTNLPSSAWADLSTDESVAFGSNVLEFDGRFQHRGGLTFIKTTSVPQAPTAYTQPQKDTFKQGWQVYSNGGTPAFDGTIPDNILSLGWNLNGEVYGEPRLRFDFESCWRLGNGEPDIFEFNVGVYTQDATTYRAFGFTLPREDVSDASKDTSGVSFYLNTIALGSMDDGAIATPCFIFDLTTTAEDSYGKRLLVGSGTHIYLASNNVPQIKQSDGAGGYINLPYVSTFDSFGSSFKTEYPISVQFNSDCQAGIFAISGQSGFVFKGTSSGRATLSQIGIFTFFDCKYPRFRDATDDVAWLTYDPGSELKLGRAGGVVQILGGYVKLNLPTSNVGVGYAWNDGGTVKVGT